MTGIEAAKLQLTHSLEHIRQALVLVSDGIAQAVAGGIKIGEQTLDVLLGGVAVGRTLNGGKDARQIGIQAVVAAGLGGHVAEQLAGGNEIALGPDSVIFGGGDQRVIILHRRVINRAVAAGDVVNEVLADEAVEQGAKHVLLEVPAIDGATHVISDGPDLTLQGGTLLGTGHTAYPVSMRFS